jgi:hypothetical protein
MKMPATFKLPGSDETFGSDVFYQVKQALDPSRLMMDQDGACTAADKRDSLSFCSHQFDVGDLGCIGAKTALFVHFFIYINDHFTKTGSGQT